jgi:hypothetical protein
VQSDGQGMGDAPVRPVHVRAGHSQATTTVGSRRSLPSLRRKETKLAQKEAHPWLVLTHLITPSHHSINLLLTLCKGNISASPSASP